VRGLPPLAGSAGGGASRHRGDWPWADVARVSRNVRAAFRGSMFCLLSIDMRVW